MIHRVISGGQTGIDRLGLEIAKELGIETGGFAPPGFYTENGYDESLKDFNLVEVESKGRNIYTHRTEMNVIRSGGTVYFKTDADSVGYFCTKRAATANGRPFIVNPTVEEFKAWINKHDIKILNVAGNRGSRLPDLLKERAEKVLRLGLVDNTKQLKLEL